MKFCKDGDISEHDIQCQFFQIVRFKARTDERYRMVYAIPNGGYRNKMTAIKIKAEGATPGVFDVAVDIPSGSYHGLKIEFKRKSTGRMSEYQKEYMALAEKYGYKCVIVYSVDEAVVELENYLMQDKNVKNI